ncbi:CBS domain-containing protein [Actinomadura scrupuli]|uniref:CBS domain-containing protein n=1 Tax=Actinomadura scrupuli TaxID=559629 RepID=UPI003D9824C4
MSISVRELMTDRVIAVRENATFAEMVAVVRRYDLASMPVIDEGDHVVGIVSEDDLLLKEAGGPPYARPFGRFLRRRDHRKAAGTTAGEVMSSPAVTVTPATPAREAARLMHRRGIHQLPVVDAGNGRLKGMLSRSDLLAVYQRPDEDIRREILADVIEDGFALDPGGFTVTVVRGIVDLHGNVERRVVIGPLAEAIGRVDGVIQLRNHLTALWDDVSPTPPKVL